MGSRSATDHSFNFFLLGITIFLLKKISLSKLVGPNIRLISGSEEVVRLQEEGNLGRRVRDIPKTRALSFLIVSTLWNSQQF